MNVNTLISQMIVALSFLVHRLDAHQATSGMALMIEELGLNSSVLKFIGCAVSPVSVRFVLPAPSRV